MSKFVVAGVTGHVGSVVARDLLAAGDSVTVIVREAKKGTEWSARGAKVAVGSLDDAGFVASTVKGADAFFTLIPPHYATGDIYSAQRKSADALAAGIKQGGVPLVVMLSSVGADRADKNGPIKSLHYAENKFRETGTKLVAVRAGSFQENVAGAVAAAKNAGIFPNFLPTADIPAPQVATPGRRPRHRRRVEVAARAQRGRRSGRTGLLVAPESPRSWASSSARRCRSSTSRRRPRRGAATSGRAARRRRGVRRDVRRLLGRPDRAQGRPCHPGQHADRRDPSRVGPLKTEANLASRTASVVAAANTNRGTAASPPDAIRRAEGER